MVNATDYLEARLMNELFGASTTTYVALYTTGSPGDSGTANAEVSGGNYARKQAKWTVSGGTASLTDPLLWTGMPAATVGGWAVFDAPTGGNMLIAAALSASKTVANGDSFSCAAGALTITCD